MQIIVAPPPPEVALKIGHLQSATAVVSIEDEDVSDLSTLELDDWLLDWAGTNQNLFSGACRDLFDNWRQNESMLCLAGFDLPLAQ